MGDKKENGKLAIISGPSGVGKSTICREIVKRFDNVCLSISATTRQKADTEVDGKDYYFLTEDEFKKKIDQKAFLEYAEVFGNLYGTCKDKVDHALSAGKTVILEIDVQGGLQVKEKYPDVFYSDLDPIVEEIFASKKTADGFMSREAIEEVQEMLRRPDVKLGEISQILQDKYSMSKDDADQAVEWIWKSGEGIFGQAQLRLGR